MFDEIGLYLSTFDGATRQTIVQLCHGMVQPTGQDPAP
jgi:hypothetical protein